MREAHESVPSVADRLRGAKRVEPWAGTAGVPNYFRRPYGPGWALVGDAGYDKDPLTAQGMSDAFIDAEALAAALDDGWSGRRALDGALAEHQAARDRRAKPMYDFTCELAKLEPAPAHMRELFAARAELVYAGSHSGAVSQRDRDAALEVMDQFGKSRR